MKLLLVEDEPYTREGIIKSIDWDEIGIDKVYIARDGKEGLDIANNYSPEIILADMRMPKMNGSKMAISIKEFLPNSAFIFMSGYSDRVYYKSALSVAALAYVDKPLVIEDLKKELIKAVDFIKRKKDVEEHMKVSKCKELATLIIRDNLNSNKLMDKWAEYKLPCDDKFEYCTMIFNDLSSEHITIKEILQMANRLDICILVSRIKIGYIIHTTIPYKKNMLKNALIEGLLYNSSSLAYVTVGKSVSHPTILKESYNEAKDLVNLKFFHPNKKIFMTRDSTKTLIDRYNPIGELSQILMKHPEKLESWIREQFNYIKKYDATPIELVKYWGFKMSTEIYFLLNRIKRDNVLSIPISEIELWQNITSFNNIDELENFVIETVKKLKDNESQKVNLPIITKVQRYIYKNFSTPLTIENISEQVHLSPNYLNYVFKESTGQTINQYIIDVRIHRAKLMLETTKMNVNEISHNIGYSSSSYFIKSFRKSAGLTPQEYRESCNVYEKNF